jgi:hypothetical protein
MFYLNFIPDSYLLLAINGILVGGAGLFLLGLLTNFVPGLLPYKYLANLIATILLASGMYFKGGYGVEAEWRSKVEEMKQKIAEAEAKSHEANVRIETQIVEKVKIIKERVNENKQAIHENKDSINAECVIPDIARVLYNRAIDHEISGSTAELNERSTEVKPLGAN